MQNLAEIRTQNALNLDFRGFRVHPPPIPYIGEIPD